MLRALGARAETKKEAESTPRAVDAVAAVAPALSPGRSLAGAWEHPMMTGLRPPSEALDKAVTGKTSPAEAICGF